MFLCLISVISCSLVQISLRENYEFDHMDYDCRNLGHYKIASGKEKCRIGSVNAGNALSVVNHISKYHAR